MADYDYTKSVDYWTGYGDEAVKHLVYLLKQKRTPAIIRAIVTAESAVKETKHRLIELGADPDVWLKYDLD